MTTTKEMNSVSVRIDEIADLVASGQLDPKAVSKQLQKIIDTEDENNGTGSALPREQGRTQINPWRSAEEQIDRAERLFPYTYIPEPPNDFIPRTESEVLLLHMPTTLMKFRDMARQYVNFGNVNIMEPIYTNPHKTVFTRPIWLGFNPKCRINEEPTLAYEDQYVAGEEVMSALIQFPDWPKTWSCGEPMPIMAGFQLGKGDNPSITLCFDSHKFDKSGEINIEVYPMNMPSMRHALPRIRVLNVQNY